MTHPKVDPDQCYPHPGDLYAWWRRSEEADFLVIVLWVQLREADESLVKVRLLDGDGFDLDIEPGGLSTKVADIAFSDWKHCTKKTTISDWRAMEQKKLKAHLDGVEEELAQIDISEIERSI